MRVPAQLAHLFQVNPAAVFGSKSSLISSIRRHHNPFGTSNPLPSPTASTSSANASTNSESGSTSDADPTFDAETVLDDRTLVEESSRRLSSSSHSGAEVVEEKSYVFKRSRTVPSSCGRGRRPVSSSERPDISARLSIIYPLPSAESLLAVTDGPTPPTTMIDAPITPALCTPFPLSPPPAHYKRRRARIMTDEDHDSDPNQAPIRFLADSDSTLLFPF